MSKALILLFGMAVATPCLAEQYDLSCAGEQSGGENAPGQHRLSVDEGAGKYCILEDGQCVAPGTFAPSHETFGVLVIADPKTDRRKRGISLDRESMQYSWDAQGQAATEEGLCVKEAFSGQLIRGAAKIAPKVVAAAPSIPIAAETQRPVQPAPAVDSYATRLESAAANAFLRGPNLVMAKAMGMAQAAGGRVQINFMVQTFDYAFETRAVRCTPMAGKVRCSYELRAISRNAALGVDMPSRPMAWTKRRDDFVLEAEALRSPTLDRDMAAYAYNSTNMGGSGRQSATTQTCETRGGAAPVMSGGMISGLTWDTSIRTPC